MDKKVSVVVVATGEIDYFQYTFPFINHYCSTHGYDLKVVKENPYRCHPSWLALIPHRFCDESEIAISMDADIMPALHAPPIHLYTDPEKVGASIDMSTYVFNCSSDRNHLFNAGLLTIPKARRTDLEDIFDQSADSSDQDREYLWEQPFFNRWARDNPNKIQILAEDWNYFELTALKRNRSDLLREPYFRHLTCGIDHQSRLENAKAIHSKEIGAIPSEQATFRHIKDSLYKIF